MQVQRPSSVRVARVCVRISKSGSVRIRWQGNRDREHCGAKQLDIVLPTSRQDVNARILDTVRSDSMQAEPLLPENVDYN